MNDTANLIQQTLNSALTPLLLDIRDNSAAHAGHAGNQSGGGHYGLTIIAAAFEGKSLVERHQIIYKALGSLMKHEIHAITINAMAPSEQKTN
jgi:BolA family transcriptional regulator, general stress-responsive regulator